MEEAEEIDEEEEVEEGKKEEDFYAVLGVPKTATTNEIKKAYYKNALTCHPDKDPSPEATQKFQKLGRIYEVSL
jgi:DnaJ-class molecular chaperone